MDSSTFQAWLEAVVPQMARLNVEQTKTLFAALIKQCPAHQRVFLEQDLRYLFAKDFMTLPSLVVDNILSYLDVESLLTLRLVCRSWRDKVSTNTPLWRVLCWQRGGRIESRDGVPPDYFFRSFLGLRRVIHLMACGSAFTRERPAFVNTVMVNRRELACSQIAYSNHTIAIGTKNRKITVGNTKTQKKLWEKTGNVASCLCISNDLIVAGTHWGQLRVLSLDGTFEYEQQCGCNSVTALDVHPTGHFVLTGYSDGTVRLVDSNLNVHVVGSEGPQHHLDSDSQLQESTIKKVFFLPDKDLPDGHLAICVCARKSVMAAVIDGSGAVMQQHLRADIHEMTSFRQCSSDPYVLYASVKLGRKVVGVVRYRLQHLDRFSGYRLDSDRLMEDMEVTSSSSAFDMLILAAGQRFMLAAIQSDFVIFDLVRCTRFATIPNFLGRYNVSRLMVEQNQDSLMAVDIDWLDGLSPTTVKGGKPLVLFGMSCMTPRGGSIIQALRWSPDLWGDSPAGNRRDGDAASHSHCSAAGEPTIRVASDSSSAFHAHEVLRGGSDLGGDGDDLFSFSVEMQGREFDATEGSEHNQTPVSEQSDTQGSEPSQTQGNEHGQMQGRECGKEGRSEHSQKGRNKHGQTNGNECGQTKRSEQSRGSEQCEHESGAGQNSAVRETLGIWRNAALFQEKAAKPYAEEDSRTLSENDFRF